MELGGNCAESLRRRVRWWGISLSASINSRTPETIKEKLEEEEEEKGWLLSHRREFLTCPTMSNGDGWEKEKTLPVFSFFFFFCFGDGGKRLRPAMDGYL